MGASAKADRAGGPADLSRCASQPEALIPCAARPSFAGDQHDLRMGYDHYSCDRCGWYMPDVQGRRGTAAVHGEMFPSGDAFAHYKRTGVRAWLGGSPCDSDGNPKGGNREH
jgi:hypothetical protein